MTNQPPPGWFPDPQGQPFERYWNGAQWTADTRQHQQPQQFNQAPSATSPVGGSAASGTPMSPQMIGGLVGAALLGVGTLLPWATDGSFSENAFQKFLPWVLTGFKDNSSPDDTFIAHGFLLVGLAIAAAIAIFMVPRRTKSTLGSAGILAMAVIGANFANFTSRFSEINDNSGGDASIGIGMYVSFAGGALLLVASFLASAPTSNPTTNAAVPGQYTTGVGPSHDASGGHPHHSAAPQPGPAPTPQQPSPPQNHPQQQPAPQQQPPAPTPPPPAEQWWNN